MLLSALPPLPACACRERLVVNLNSWKIEQQVALARGGKAEWSEGAAQSKQVSGGRRRPGAGRSAHRAGSVIIAAGWLSSSLLAAPLAVQPGAPAVAPTLVAATPTPPTLIPPCGASPARAAAGRSGDLQSASIEVPMVVNGQPQYQLVLQVRGRAPYLPRGAATARAMAACCSCRCWAWRAGGAAEMLGLGRRPRQRLLMAALLFDSAH